MVEIKSGPETVVENISPSEANTIGLLEAAQNIAQRKRFPADSNAQILETAELALLANKKYPVVAEIGENVVEPYGERSGFPDLIANGKSENPSVQTTKTVGGIMGKITTYVGATRDIKMAMSQTKAELAVAGAGIAKVPGSGAMDIKADGNFVSNENYGANSKVKIDLGKSGSTTL